MFWSNFLRRMQNVEKQAKNGVSIGAQGAFRKFFGSVTKYGYLKIVQRGDPLGR